MDYPEPKTKRTKKSDKQKKTFEKYGHYSQKHIHLTEALQALRKAKK